jgi:hypothetical protein
MSNELTPSYLDFNFDLIKQDLKDKMAESPVFRDYNTDASNLTFLMELVSYLGELNAYYLNKIAKNVFIDTADIRENIVRLGYLVGYYPNGSRSSRCMLTVNIPSAAPHSPDYGCQVGDTICVNAWKEINTKDTVKYNNAIVPFTTTNNIYHTVESFPITLTVPVAQGVLRSYTYYGRDLIDDTLYLPALSFGYDDNLEDEYPSLEVRVNNITWTRVNDFYDNLSGLQTDDTVYVFRYNKYGQYIIRFSNARSIPAANDEITIYLLETLGSHGDVAAESITSPDYDLITVTTSGAQSFNLSSDWYTVINTAASTGGADIETNESIKSNIEGMTNAQYRCVTRSDYITYLEAHPTIKKASAWGEKDRNPEFANILDYNKVYISINPVGWDGTLAYITNADGINIAHDYETSYLTTITEYLEPRKMICAYEQFVVPDFTYFMFNFGIKIKRNYRFTDIVNDVKNKLTYYFSSADRTFGELISFMDIVNYIMDPTKTMTGDRFSNVKGIYYMNVRDIDFYYYPAGQNPETEIVGAWRNPWPAGNGLYPQFVSYSSSAMVEWDENTLKNIQLGFNQYPMVSINDCIFNEES